MLTVMPPSTTFNVLMDIVPVVHTGCLCDSLFSSTNVNQGPNPWGSECSLSQEKRHSSKPFHKNPCNERLKHGKVRWMPSTAEDLQNCGTDSVTSKTLRNTVDHSHSKHCSISRLTFSGSSTNVIHFEFNHQASPYLAINDYRLSHTYPNMQPPSIRRENRRKAASAAASVNRCCSHPSHSAAQKSLSTAVRKIPSLTLPRTIFISPEYPDGLKYKKGCASSTTSIELAKRQKQSPSSSSLSTPKIHKPSMMDANISFKLCWLEQPSFLIQPTKSLDIVRRASENGIMELKKHRHKQPSLSSSSSNKNKNVEERVRESPKSSTGVMQSDTHTSFTQQYMLKPSRVSDISQTQKLTNSDSIHSIITINSPWGTNC